MSHTHLPAKVAADCMKDWSCALLQLPPAFYTHLPAKVAADCMSDWSCPLLQYTLSHTVTDTDTLTSKRSGGLHERLELPLVAVEPGGHLQQRHLLNQVVQRQRRVEPAVNRHRSCLHKQQNSRQVRESSGNNSEQNLPGKTKSIMKLPHYKLLLETEWCPGET